MTPAVVGAKPWPTHYDAPPADWKAGETANGYAYRSNSYLILSREELGHGRVDEIVTTAESVREALELFPLALLPPRDARRRPEEPHVVRILATTKAYAESGGPAGSVGYFDGLSGEVLVCLEHLIEPKGPRSNLAPRQRYRLLVHELVHQAMGRRLGELPVWMTEGIAEYLAAVQFAPGRYRFENCSRAIIDHLYKVWAHGRPRAVTVPDIATLSAMSHHAWGIDNEMNKANAYAKYAGSLLLVHYHMELAARGLGGLREYLEADPARRRVGAGRRFRLIPADQTLLWKDRDPAAAQRQIAAYWKSKGLEVRFARPRDPGAD